MAGTDALLTYSSAQAITATADSTNVVDHSAIRNLGVGEPIYLRVACVVAMTDSGSDSTVTVALETDSVEAMSGATTQRTLDVFAALSAAGEERIIRMDPGDLNEQYSQLVYTVANGNLTTGSFDAHLLLTPQQWTAYADNITITGPS
jgi:hypothetical protein